MLVIHAGEYLWTPEGTHILDENGFAMRAEEETEVTFVDQETFDRVLAIVNFGIEETEEGGGE